MERIRTVAFSVSSQMTVVTGRRRIGKTKLIMKANEAEKAEARTKLCETENAMVESQLAVARQSAVAVQEERDEVARKCAVLENECSESRSACDSLRNSLKAMESKMLLYLLENRGRVVTKDELLKNVWDDEYIGEGTLAVHIRHLREKIETDPKNPDIIKTVWGVGYMIEEA